MGNSVGNRATDPVLLKRTAHPGVYRRGAQYVAVYRRGGNQRKESAATFAEARAIKLARDAEANEERRGPTLHAYALAWVACHAGSGHDAVREQTREEYRRLLATFTLAYFPASLRLADIDRRALQGFIGWLTDRPGRRGRLSDRSIRNALTPLRLCLEAGAREGLLDSDLVRSLVLPSRRGGRRWEVSERRFLTRQQLGRLLAEIPKAHEPLFMLLASRSRACGRTRGRVGDRPALVAPHLRFTADRAGCKSVAPTTLNGPPLRLETYGHLIDDELGSALQLTDLAS